MRKKSFVVILLWILSLTLFSQSSLGRLPMDNEAAAEDYLKALNALPLAWVDTEKAVQKAEELGHEWPRLQEDKDFLRYLEKLTSLEFENLQSIANQCEDISSNVDKKAQLLGYASYIGYQPGVNVSFDYDGNDDSPLNSRIDFSFRIRLGEDFVAEKLEVPDFSDPLKMAELLDIDKEKYQQLHPRHQKILPILIEKISSTLFFQTLITYLDYGLDQACDLKELDQLLQAPISDRCKKKFEELQLIASYDSVSSQIHQSLVSFLEQNPHPDQLSLSHFGEIIDPFFKSQSETSVSEMLQLMAEGEESSKTVDQLSKLLSDIKTLFLKPGPEGLWSLLKNNLPSPYSSIRTQTPEEVDRYYLLNRDPRTWSLPEVQKFLVNGKYNAANTSILLDAILATEKVLQEKLRTQEDSLYEIEVAMAVKSQLRTLAPALNQALQDSFFSDFEFGFSAFPEYAKHFLSQFDGHHFIAFESSEIREAKSELRQKIIAETLFDDFVLLALYTEEVNFPVNPGSHSLFLDDMLLDLLFLSPQATIDHLGSQIDSMEYFCELQQGLNWASDVEPNDILADLGLYTGIGSLGLAYFHPLIGLGAAAIGFGFDYAYDSRLENEIRKQAVKNLNISKLFRKEGIDFTRSLRLEQLSHRSSYLTGIALTPLQPASEAFTAYNATRNMLDREINIDDLPKIQKYFRPGTDINLATLDPHEVYQNMYFDKILHFDPWHFRPPLLDEGTEGMDESKEEDWRLPILEKYGFSSIDEVAEWVYLNRALLSGKGQSATQESPDVMEVLKPLILKRLKSMHRTMEYISF